MRRLLPLLPLIAVTACSAPKKSARMSGTLDTISVSANQNPLSIYRESAPKTWDIQHTKLALQFDYSTRTADGRAWLTMKPYCCAQDSIVLDAKSMRIDSVAWLADGVYKPLTFHYADDQIVIRNNTANWPKATAAGASGPAGILYIVYTAMPYADSVRGGSAAINDDRGLYFINADRAIPGKPVQIWTQGESESNSHWMPTIDKPNERFTTELALTVPDSFQTLSNGALTRSKTLAKGLRTDVWEMKMPIQAYAVMFAIGRYAIVKDSWQGKEVNYYVEPEFAPHAKHIFRHTPEMLTYFSQVTGVPYPWNKYSQIVARDYVSGAMENTTASLFGEFVNQTAREIEDHGSEDVVSHELFHQWFGDYATFESWSNLTVSESFANYGEQLWRRHYYGDAWADELALEDLRKYLSRAEYGDPQLVRFHYRDREEMFDHVSYNKGGAILNYLKGLLGDTLFSKSMQTYLQQNALQSTEATHWRLAVESASGRDWNWFFNQFYYRAGHPVLDVSYKYDDVKQQVKVTVRQQNKPDSNQLYQLPLKAGIIYDKSLTVADWLLKKRVETFTYPYKSGKRPLVVPDYTHWLPGELIDHKTMNDALTQLQRTNDYTSKIRALMLAGRNFKDPVSKTVFESALNDPLDGVRVRALELLADKPAQESMRQRIAYLAVQDEKNRVRAMAFRCLGAWKVTDMNAELLKAVDDRSYAVSGAALEALYVADRDAAYTKAKMLLPTDPKAEQEQAVWKVIAGSANDSDLYIFQARVAVVYGTRRARLAGYLSAYLANVRTDRTFDQGLALLDQLYKAEGIKSYKGWIFSDALSRLSTLGTGTGSKVPKDQVKIRRAKVRKVMQGWVDDQADKGLARTRLQQLD